MSREDLTLCSRLIPLMLAHARANGVALEPLLKRYAIAEAEVDLARPGRAELVTPVQAVRALAEELAVTLGDESFGLSLARSVPRGAYGVAEFLVSSAATLREAIENLVRFNALLAPSQTFRLEETDDEAQLHHSLTAKPGAMGRHLNEYTTAMLVKGQFALTDVPIKRVWFCNPRPASIQPLVDWLRTDQLAFEQATSGYAVERRFLGGEARGKDAALFAFLEEHALAALASRPKVNELIDHLRRGIRGLLGAGEPNVEVLASRLHMSSRTLQRRLAELHTTFQDVLDDVRFDLARAYLKDERLDISEVAYLLGYSELRAFDRAFRRWANMTPREWRQRG